MHGKSVSSSFCSPLKNFPKKIEFPATLQELLTAVHTSRTCVGNPDKQYLSLVDKRKGKVRRGSEDSAFVDD